MKQIILRLLPRLLPAGALFLPLGTLTIKLLVEKATQYNIVELVRTFGSENNELFVNLLKSDSMAPARPWLVVTAVGLLLGILAILAGLALAWRESIKLHVLSAAVYAGGTAGVVLAIVGFSRFGAILAEAVRSIANTSLSFGTWVLMALLLLNAAVCYAQWRAAKERARLAALAAKKRKRK